MCICCVAEILRVCAPDAPYSKDEIILIFESITKEIETLKEGLLSNWKPAYLLHSLVVSQCSLVLVALDAPEMVLEIFGVILASVHSCKRDGNF